MSAPTAENPGKRARKRAETERAILDTGRRHLARDGAAGLSLRAVARDLGMVSSAVYRYVASRDELLTLLIVQAYDSLGDAVDAALIPGASAEERFRQIGRAVRAWALDHPEQFALVYGSPVPGYHAPGEQTGGPGTRVTNRLLEAFSDMAPGRSDEDPRAAAALAPIMRMVGQVHPGLGASAMSRGLSAWLLVLGAVRAESFEEFGADAFADPAAWFEVVLDQALELLGR
ncbi:TetR/AcrR family transcriptional regulator [Tessaracoccus lubricantis]